MKKWLPLVALFPMCDQLLAEPSLQELETALMTPGAAIPDVSHQLKTTADREKMVALWRSAIEQQAAQLPVAVNSEVSIIAMALTENYAGKIQVDHTYQISLAAHGLPETPENAGFVFGGLSQRVCAHPMYRHMFAYGAVAHYAVAGSNGIVVLTKEIDRETCNSSE